MIVKSGARRQHAQIRTLAGMKGLVTNSKGELHPPPDQVLLPRGPVRSRVLQQHPRFP